MSHSTAHRSLLFALGHTPYDFLYLQILRGVQVLCARFSRRVLTNYPDLYFCFSRLKALQTRLVTSCNGAGMVSQAVSLNSVISFTVTLCLG